jgi:hypothetical protein
VSKKRSNYNYKLLLFFIFFDIKIDGFLYKKYKDKPSKESNLLNAHGNMFFKDYFILLRLEGDMINIIRRLPHLELTDGS